MTLRKHYYASLDGLRAMSVMFVLLFHAGFNWLKGGFIGVDVFFVISGFLITGNIIRDLNENRWSFSAFYFRRIARLLPALFVVILGTMFFSYFILSPENLEKLGETSIYTSLSLSNFFFWNELNYFDQSSELKPLLHTWSLSVEEQFYLIWPLLIVFCYGLKHKYAVMTGLFILGITSLILAYIVNANDSSAVFYLTPFRGYQFTLGGLIALIGIGSKENVTSIANIVSVITLVMLAFIVNGEQNNLFMTATLPAISAALFIWSSENRIAKYVYASPLFLWIGKRSYSIYLVHWPLMVLWKIATDYKFDAVESLASCIFSIAIGTFLYEFIEKRFRLRPSYSIKHKSYIAMTTTILLVSILFIGANIWGYNGFPERIAKETALIELNMTELWNKRKKELRTNDCNILVGKLSEKGRTPSYNMNVCSKPSIEKKSIFIIGDSYASDTYLIFKRAYPDVYIGQMTIPGCRLRLPSDFTGTENKECIDFYKLAFDKIITTDNYSKVIISSNWDINKLNEIENLVKHLKSKNVEIIMIGQRLRFLDRIPSIIASSKNLSAAHNRAQKLIDESKIKTNNTLENRFSKMVKYIDMLKIQCEKECDIVNDKGKLLYLDESHINIDGADVFANRLRNKYPDLMK